MYYRKIVRQVGCLPESTVFLLPSQGPISTLPAVKE